MLFRKSTPQAKFAGWAFVDLVIIFSVMSAYRPAAGLAGIGTVLILGSILVEANHEAVWEGYKRSYKKPKSKTSDFWQKPTKLYYDLNVYVVWPIMFILGCLSVYAAYLVGK